MRQAALTCARSALLAGPVALAFFTGGYFDQPRVWAGLTTWALVVVAVLTVRRPLPRSLAGWLAIAGLGLFAAWTLLSYTWSLVPGTAYHDGQRVFVYFGALLAASMLLRGRTIEAVEPTLAAGTVVVVGYGMSERLLPGLLIFARSASADGRLEQPLTYWNAMGALAAIGLVLCAHMAGSRDRPAPVRIAAAVASALLGVGLYCTFSRGALFAGAVGLIAVLVLAPTKSVLRGVMLNVAIVVLSSLCAAPFAGVTSLAGSRQTRVTQSIVVLVLLGVVAVAAGTAEWLICKREADGRLRTGPLSLPRYSGWVALIAVVASFGLFLLAGASEKSGEPSSVSAARLTSLQTNRYAYWSVAWRAFRAEPLRGVGGGGWAVYWLRYRSNNTGAQDAHSLYIQTAAELGLVGLALLATFLAGVVLAARQALCVSPALAAGPIAGFVVWAAHAAVDWDWEMPALTLLAILLAGALLGLSEQEATVHDATAERATLLTVAKSGALAEG